MRYRTILLCKCILVYLLIFPLGGLQAQERELTEEQELLQVMHSIHSQTLFEYVGELSSEKYW